MQHRRHCAGTKTTAQNIRLHITSRSFSTFVMMCTNTGKISATASAATTRFPSTSSVISQLKLRRNQPVSASCVLSQTQMCLRYAKTSIEIGRSKERRSVLGKDVADLKRRGEWLRASQRGHEYTISKDKMERQSLSRRQVLQYSGS